MMWHSHEVEGDPEAEVAAVLEAAWGCSMYRCDPASRVDWLAWKDGKQYLAVEIKCRSHQYDTLLLSARKWLNVQDVGRLLHVHSVLVVRFPGGSIRWADLEKIPVVGFELAGRTDRGDPDDIEPCVFLPVDEMGTVRAS